MKNEPWRHNPELRTQHLEAKIGRQKRRITELEALHEASYASSIRAGMERAAGICEGREATHERNSKSRSLYTRQTLAVHMEEDRHCAAAIRAALPEGDSNAD